MSKEFETLDQPLMVEIIRRRQIPAEGAATSGAMPTSSVSSNNIAATPGTSLKEDMQRYVKLLNSYMLFFININ